MSVHNRPHGYSVSRRSRSASYWNAFLLHFSVTIVAVPYLGRLRHHFGAIVASVSEPFPAKLFDPVNVSAGSEPVCLFVVAAVLVPAVHEPAET